MGRRKVSMGLIPNRRVRVGTFTKRKEGLKKKADELAVLCGVDVALVVASSDVDAPADVWESKEGVLARYRALAPEAHARHTQRAYLDAELGKVEAKLARVRQGGPDGLGRWDKALDGVATAEEAQRLLDDVDAAIRATQDRRRALGMPVEEEDEGARIVLEGVEPLSFATVHDGYLLHAPGDNTSNDQQAMMWNSNGFHHQGNPVAMQSGGYGLFHQYSSCNGAGMEGYHLQMAPDMCGNSDAYQQQMQHGYGFHHAGYFGMPADHQMTLMGSGPNLGMWSADEPCLAMVPVEYPSADINYADTSAAHGARDIGGGSFAMGISSSNFVNSPPALSLATGTGSNFIDAPPADFSACTIGGSGDNFTKVTPAQPLAISYGGDLTNVVGRYATQWQLQCAGSNQNPSTDELPYLSDVEDTQLHLWGN